MKTGLLTFPALFNTFYNGNKTDFAQRLEPSVLYVAPNQGESVFIADNKPRNDVDIYLCSVYTRGWNEFRNFSLRVGKEKIIAGGHSPAETTLLSAPDYY